MAGEKTVYIKVGAKVDGAVAGLRKVKGSVDDLTKANLQKPQAAFDGLSSKAALMGGVVALGVGKAVSSFADFDQQMSEVNAALPEAGAQMERLRGLALKLGADTQFSATEAAQGITEMAKAGVSANDIYNGGLKGGLDLAAAGALSVADASEIAATAVNQFNLKGADVPHIADLYAAAAGKAQGSVQDVASAMKYAGVQAGAMGISIEETTGVIGLFASKGIVGEQAGTSFRSMLMSLTSPSKQAQKAMGELGINVYDASGKFVGMQGAAEVLQQKLGPLDEATRNAALGQIFGNESMAAAITLYQAGGKGVAEWTKNVNVAGFASEQAAKKTDNLKGDLERLGGSIETAFITSGSAANGALRTLTQGLGGLVDKIAEVPAPVLLATTGLAALALTVPKGLSAYRSFTRELDTMGISMEKFSAKAPRTAKAFSIVGKAAGALAVASAAVYAFQSATEKIDGDKLSGALTKAGDGLAFINEQLASQTDNGWGRIGSDIDSFGKVLGATFDPGIINNIDDTIGSFKTIFGGENVSNIANATKQLNGIDAALSGLVAAGNADKAKAAFAQMTQVAKDQGISVDQLKAKFPLYAAAIANAGNEAAVAGPKMDDMSDDVKAIEQKADDAKKALDDLRTTLEGFGSPLAKQRAAQRDYKDAIDAARKALKGQRDEIVKQRLDGKDKDQIVTDRLKDRGVKGTPTKAQQAAAEQFAKKQIAMAERYADVQLKSGVALDTNTEAGRNNQAALDAIRDKALGAATATFDLTKNSKLAADEVKRGREDFIKQAVALGLSATEAAGLADNMHLIPKEVETTIGLSGVETANTQLDKTTGKVTVLDNKTAKPTIEPKLNGLQIDVANVRLDKVGRRVAKPVVAPVLNGTQMAVAEARLDMLARSRTALIVPHFTNVTGVVPGDVVGGRGGVRAATGGHIRGPGTTTSDSIPALLSDKEYVIKAAAVQKYGVHLFDNLNAMRLASGGPVGRPALTNYRSAPAGSVTTVRGPSAAEIGAAVAAHMGPQIGTIYGGPDTLTAVRQAKREWDWEMGNR